MVNRGTKEGTIEEINFVKKLNKKDDLKLWDTLNLSSDNHFAVHIKHNKLSKINQKKVKPKADIFISEGYVDDIELKKKEYYLSEDDLNDFNLKPVSYTGISVKLKTSKNYQIIKMTPNTFEEIFQDRELGAGISLFSQKEKDLKENINVLNGWNVKLTDFKQYFSKVIDFEIDENMLTLEEASIIKQYSIKNVTKQIKESPDIKKFIFQGIGNFEEPFTVHYLYENDVLRNNCEVPFSITTGSGRHKGTYTVVLKPKKY